MNILKYAAGIPAVAAVVATLYGGLQYVRRLQNTIENNEKTILVMQAAMSADAVRFDTTTNANYRELSNLHKLLETTTAQALKNEVEKITDNLGNVHANLNDRISAEMDKLNSELANIHASLNDRISAEMDKLNIRVNNNDERLKSGREELLIEMTNFSKVIADINAKVNVLRDGSYKTASMVELSALEELVRNTSDSMREFTYSIKEMERKLNGGY